MLNKNLHIHIKGPSFVSSVAPLSRKATEGRGKAMADKKATVGKKEKYLRVNIYIKYILCVKF